MGYTLGATGINTQQSNNNNKKHTAMTTRKYNMIRKNTYLDGYTFTAIFDYLESAVNLDTYKAKQIADMMEICYAQNEMGYDRCAHENSIY